MGGGRGSKATNGFEETQLIIIIIGRAVQFLLMLAMLRVATTLLSPEEMGRVSIVMTTVACFAMFLINPVGMFINRRLHAWQKSGIAWHYLLRYVNYLLLVGVAATIGLSLFNLLGLVNFGLSLVWLIFLVCGSLVFNTINQTLISALNLLGDYGTFVLLSVATIAASFAFGTLIVQMLKPLAQYWLLGLLLGQTLLAAIGCRVLYTRLQNNKSLQGTPVIQKLHFQALYRFAWPISIAAGLGWVQGQGYRYLLEGQLGLTQLGLFVAGYGISAGMIAGFESILTTYFQPRLYREVSTALPVEQAQAWKRYATAVIPSLLLTVAFIVMLAPELTRIFLGVDFQSAAKFLVWGALAEAARVLMGIYSMIAHVYMRTRWLIIPNMIGAILSISLCMLLIPSFGAAGAGMGLVLSGIAVVLTMHFMLARHVGGGAPTGPVVVAGLASFILWVVTQGLHFFVSESGWWKVVTMIFTIGSIFLVLQYMFLRRHLVEDKEE